MRVAIVSDLHVHSWAEFSTDNDGVPSRLRNCIKVLAEVRVYCVEHGIAVVVVGGDLFHKRGVVYTQAFNLVAAQLAEMKRAGLVVLAVDGNHDHANKAGTVHTLEALEDAGLLTCVAKEHGWSNWHLEGGKHELVVSGFSYCDGADLLKRRVEESTAEAPDGAPRIGVFHHGFRGSRVGTVLEYMVREEIDASFLTEHAFDYIFSGHYHARQAIVGVPNGTYIGSPMEQVRGETKQKRGFLVYDTRAKTFELVRLRRPRFVQLTQDHWYDKDFDVEARVSGNYVDFLIKKLPANWDDVLKQLGKFGALGVKPIVQKATKKAKTRLAISTTMGTKEVLELYLDHHKHEIDDRKLDRAELLRLGTDLLRRAEEKK